MHDKDTELGLAAEAFALGLVLDQGELVVDVVLEFADGVSGVRRGSRRLHARVRDASGMVGRRIADRSKGDVLQGSSGVVDLVNDENLASEKSAVGEVVAELPLASVPLTGALLLLASF